MDNSIFQVAQMLFTNSLKILQINIPWLGMTFLQLFLGILVVNVAIYLIRSNLFENILPEKGGNNDRIKISKERKGDTQ